MQPFVAVLAVVLLAGALACVDAGTRPAAVTELADSADQLLSGFETAVTRDGLRRARITADTARLYEASQSLALRTVRMTFFDAQGAERSKLVADSATLFWTSGLIIANGKVVLTSPDGRVLRSEALRVDEGAREISTDKPFTLSGGADFVRGSSLRTDPEFRNVVAAKPRGFSDKPIALPGQ